MPIPAFDRDTGALPPGVHAAGWQEVEQRFGGTQKRRALFDGLRRACESLRRAGCARVYINGSFVTAKEEPKNFDGCWNAEGVDPELLDPILLDFENRRANQKAAFGGELFPTEWSAAGGKTFLEFFQTDRNGRAKGIVAIDLQGGEQ